MSDKENRKVSQSRVTEETNIELSINLDGDGSYSIDTGNGMFDHLLAQLSRHGLIDVELKAEGDIKVGWHHLVEDTAIVMGRAFKLAVGEGKGVSPLFTRPGSGRSPGPWDRNWGRKLQQ